MKLGFEETQSPYSSGSQSARVWTERWVKDWIYRPNCGSSHIDQFPANRPVADFVCPSCAEEYELKSQKKAFGAKVLDVAFRTMSERKKEFELDDVYAFAAKLSKLYPNNRHVKQKIRQQLQFLRDRGYLDFVSRGFYRLRS